MTRSHGLLHIDLYFDEVIHWMVSCNKQTQGQKCAEILLLPSMMPGDNVKHMASVQ